MKRIQYIILLIVLPFFTLGTSAQGYKIFQYDNGNDYIREGLRRIYDDNGKIGFADDKENVIINRDSLSPFPLRMVWLR